MYAQICGFCQNDKMLWVKALTVVYVCMPGTVCLYYYYFSSRYAYTAVLYGILPSGLFGLFVQIISNACCIAPPS